MVETIEKTTEERALPKIIRAIERESVCVASVNQSPDVKARRERR